MLKDWKTEYKELSHFSNVTHCLSEQIEEYEKNEERLRSGQGRDYAFEFHFKRAQAEHEQAKSTRHKGDVSPTQCATHDASTAGPFKKDVSPSSDTIQT